MATVLPNGKQQYFGDDGNFLNGGKLFTYQAGTTTPKPTYQDAEATVENTNPVILDTRGEAIIFWVGSYDITLTDALGTEIYSVPGLSEPTADYRTSPTGSAIIPAGSTSQRDDPAQPGYFRFNTDTNLFEGYVDALWKSFQELLISGTNIKTINGQSLLAAGDLAIPATLLDSSRTTDIPIAQTDLSTVIGYDAGATTQTFNFAAAPALEDGLWFITENRSGGIITVIATGGGTLDGRTTYPMYPNEKRLWRYRQAENDFASIVLNPYKVRFTVSDVIDRVPGYTFVDIESQAPGAGGGGGEGRALATARSGGSGGGAGGRLRRRIPSSLIAPTIGTTAPVIIGAAGAGGAGANLAVGGNGVAGGNNTLISEGVTLMITYGGGGGGGGNGASVITGGSGGGSGGAGNVGSATGAVGGLPSSSSIGFTAASTVNNVSGGGAGTSTTTSGNSEWGGAGGGGQTNLGAGGFGAGSSIEGAGGGGAGASITTANTIANAIQGGAHGKYTAGGGGLPGNSAGAGTPGLAGLPADGGGGGGAGSAGAGGIGGAGRDGGGGGGGGAGTGAVGGAGGAGGPGWMEFTGVI